MTSSLPISWCASTPPPSKQVPSSGLESNCQISDVLAHCHVDLRKIVGKTVTFQASGEKIEQCLERQFDMTAHVCTAWYRAPELLVATSSVNRLDRETEPGATQLYGASVDVWSFGAVVYELLSGEQLARAFTGAELLNCLLQKLEPCPHPCSDAGKSDIVPAYMDQPGWAALHQAACKLPKRHRTWPDDDERWAVVGACLRWHPARRLPMMHVLSMPWLRDVANEASPAAQEGTDSAVVSGQGLAFSSHVSAACQVNAGPALRDSFARASSPGRHASGPSVLNLSRDYSTRHTVTSEDIMCKCKGHCRIFGHREQGKCVEAAVVKHTGYCVKCLCKVYGCDSAKHKSDFCYMHKRILEQLPVHARLAVLAADVAHRLVPCEILDFLTIYEEIKSDLAMCIICAIVYEPAANAIILAQWRQLPPDYDAQALAKGLEACVLVVRLQAGPLGSRQMCMSRSSTRKRAGVAVWPHVVNLWGCCAKPLIKHRAYPSARLSRTMCSRGTQQHSRSS